MTKKVTRTLRLAPDRDVQLEALAAATETTVDDLVEELARESIAIEEADFPALKGCTMVSRGVPSDYIYSWTPGAKAERVVHLPHDLDLRIRQIAFAQGTCDGNLFARLVDQSLTRALVRK